MDPFTVTIQLEPADLKRFHRFVRKRSGMSQWRGLILFAVAVLLIGGSFMLRKGAPGRHPPDGGVEVDEPRSARSFDILSGVTPVALFVGIFAFYYWRATRPSAYEEFSPGIFQPNTYEVLDRGFLCRSARGETINYWHVITRFAETDQDFFVMLAARNGHVLPKRCFPTLEAAAIFTNQIRMHLEKHAPAALAVR